MSIHSSHALPLLLLAACQAPESQSEQDTLHYAQWESTTDYFAPFRAKVWEQGQWATGTGYLGVDEEGVGHLIFHPRELRLDDSLLEIDSEMVRMEIQWEADRVLLGLTNQPNGSGMTLSSLYSSEMPEIEEGAHPMWPWRVWPSDLDALLSFDATNTEWRLTLPHDEGEEILIFEQGGPWAERPDGSIPIFAEPEPGRFTRDGVELVAPYWNIQVKH
ncbi:MAG: hypothetical protein ACPG31_01150 [Planctomycetota bacterium]